MFLYQDCPDIFLQPPADVLKRLADFFGTSIDYLVYGEASEKAKETINDAELISLFKNIETLPETERKAITKVVGAYVRDYKARQTYGSTS